MTSHCVIDEPATGTPDEPWQRLLKAQAAWSPEGVPLIVIATHPGQETLGAGGLIASYARRLRPVIIVSVTDGQSSGSGWQGQQAMRRAELKQALALLSPHLILQTRLGLVEGDVQGHEQSLHDLLRHLIRPGALLVAPYQHDANADSDAVGSVCRRVALEHDLLLARYPVQPWHELDFQALRDRHWARFDLSEESRAAKTLALKAFKPSSQPAPASPCPASHDVVSPYEAFLL